MDTDKLPIPCRCFSNDCRESLNSQRIIYLDTVQGATCPNCNRKGNIVQCENIHLLIEEKGGPIKGSMMLGTADIEYNFLCEEARKNFNQYRINPVAHYTALPTACTCVKCLLEYGAKLTGQNMTLPK